MKRKLLGILLTVLMVCSVFALTSCDDLIDSLLGNNEPPHEHAWSEWETIKNPDCQNPGTAERFCDCGETQQKSVPITDHKESNWIVDKDATCISEGTKHKECTVCKTVLTTETIGKTDHTYGEWIGEVPSTTEKEGTLGHYHCSVCEKNFDADKEELDNLVISKLEPDIHTHTESDWIVDKDATCVTEGSKHKECTECKEELSRETIPATGNHLYGEWTETKAAECETKGEERRDCDTCDHFETRELSELSHDKVQHEGKAATCIESGYEAYETCTRCDYSTYVEIPATNEHIYGEWTETKAAECETKGEERRDCETCEHFETREVAELGHDKVQHEGKEATCTESGYKAYETCTRCDYTTYVEIPAINEHVYGVWYETRAAECETKGEERRDCANCDHFETREIAELGHHILQHGNKPATCAESGYEAYETCTRCDYSTYVEIPATNEHVFGEWTETKAAECETKGEERRDCANCDHFETRELPELGHDKVQHEGKAATCAESGYEAYETCTRCDYSTYVEIPATNEHVYGEWSETKAAECETKGEERRDCENCDHFEIIVVAELGHDKVQHEGKEATCIESGFEAYETCTRCDHSTYTEISALGHSPSDWIIDVEATYETDGHKYKECTRCEILLDEEIIPHLGAIEHNIYYHNVTTDENYPECFAEHLGLYDLPAAIKTGYNEGYWVDESGNLVLNIPIGTNKDVHLYAVIENPITYTIQYIDAPINDSNPVEYTIETSSIVLQSPSWGGLVFSHWVDEEGKEISEITQGTYGNRVLTAHWILKENYAIPTSGNRDFLVLFDEEHNRYYIIYKLGTINNIVLGSLGIKGKEYGHEISWENSEVISVSENIAKEISETIGKSVIHSSEYSNQHTWANSKSTTQRFDVSAGIEIGNSNSKVRGKIEASYGNSVTNEKSWGSAEGSVQKTEQGSEQSQTMASLISYNKDQSTTLTTTDIIGNDMPVGNYEYVCTGTATVFAMITFDISNNYYYLDTYSIIEEDRRNTILYTPDITHNRDNIKENSTLPYDIDNEVLKSIENYIESSYYIIYDSNGGEGDMNASVNAVGKVTQLQNNAFTKTGYSFKGWSTEPNGDVKYLDSEEVCDIAEKGKTIKLYAKWEIDTYTITFDPNSSTVVTDITHPEKEKEIVFGESGTIVAPKAEYYIFNGWYTDPEGGEIVIGSDGTFENWSITGNITLYAQWSQEFEGTYIYDENSLRNISEVNSGTYHVVKDIPLEKEWIPIDLFKGTIDGHHHTISNMNYKYYSSPTNYGEAISNYGFIREMSGTISNLTFDKLTIDIIKYKDNILDNNVGGVVGYLNYGSIDNVHIINSNIKVEHYREIKSEKQEVNVYVGGIVGLVTKGYIYNSTITSSNVSGSASKATKEATAHCYSGGIAGYIKTGEIVNCERDDNTIVSSYADGAKLFSWADYTRGFSFAGGIVGCAGTDVKVNDCISTKTNVNAYITNVGYDGLNKITGNIVGYQPSDE